MDELLAKLSEYLDAAAKVIGTVAPQVWEVTLLVIRLQGIFSLALGFLLLSVIAVYYLKYFPKMWKLTADPNNGHYHDEGPKVALCVISGAVTIVLVILTGVCLQFSAWLSAFWPQAALIYRVGEKAGV